MRNAERVAAVSSAVVSGRREKVVIPKENNFAQAGARWRSFNPDRQERFVVRVADMLSDPRCTQVGGGRLHV